MFCIEDLQPYIHIDPMVTYALNKTLCTLDRKHVRYGMRCVRVLQFIESRHVSEPNQHQTRTGRHQ